MTEEEYIEYLAILAEREQELGVVCEICNKPFKTEELYDKHIKTSKHEQKDKLEEQRQQRVCAKREILLSEKQNVAVDEVHAETPENDQDCIKIDAPCFCNYEEAIVFKELLPKLLQMNEEEEDELILQEIILKRPVVPPNCCLFCIFEHDEFSMLMKHMDEEHGFFIPRAQYADQKGIMLLLETIFGQSRECIVCDKSFFTLKGLEAHMISKRHCLPDCENFPVMFNEFYDFTSTYPAEMVEEAAGQPELLALMKAKPFRLERGDFETRFELNRGGRIFTLMEWYRYRKARVSEWAEIRAREVELIKSLERMGKSAIKEAHSSGAGTEIVLSDEASNIVSQVNEMANGSENKYLLRITDEWLEKQYAMQASEPEEMLMRLERREIEARRDAVSEGINHFKPHFKRSTLYLRGDK